jgi:hypothetical protein
LLLLRWGVPSAARAHAEIFAVIRHDFDGAVTTIVFEIRGLVGDGVLAAEFILNRGEGVGYLANLEGEEGVSAGSIGDAFENFVTRTLGAADVGADGVDDGFGPLRHFDGFFAGNVTLVVVAIAQQNDGATNRQAFCAFEKLVATGVVQGVVESSATARAEFVNAMGQSLRVVSEILGDFRSYIEANDECLIFLGVNGLIQEFDGGFLLELKAVAHGVAGVDEQADLEGKIGFGVEAANLLRRFVVVDDAEIGLLEISYASTLLVGYCEDDVDLVGAGLGAEGSSARRVTAPRATSAIMESLATRMSFVPKVLMDTDIIAAQRNLVLSDLLAGGFFQNLQECL